MIKTLVKCKNPEILAITPLRKGDKVSLETKKTLKRCKVPFMWITYMGEGNPYKNMIPPYKWYRKEFGSMPPYIIKIDNDLACRRGMLDELYKALESSDRKEGYAYCNFKFRGAVNLDFDNMPFNIDRLLRQNYISSISLMKTNALESTGGFVTDDKYFRLLDWALWLQFLRGGYTGKYVPETSFTATAGKQTVSARGQQDYQIKARAVVQDFIVPYGEKFNTLKERLAK